VRTIVKGKNMDVPEAVRRYAERKMGRLERFLDDRTEAIIELSVERHRSADDSRIAEVTLIIDGRPLRGRADASTYEAAIDVVVDKVERRAVAHREKPRVRAHGHEMEEILTRIADGTADSARERRIVKTKRFAIKPMFEEDAIAEMEALGHSFFVFVNADSERVNVLYRRNDGDYGLIEPVVAGNYTAGRGSRR
jgi:putative sigma-54 modulation protein